MRLLDVQINKIHFTGSGYSRVEIGYYYKPSDDADCDDVTMGHTDIFLSNDDILPFLDGIVAKCRVQMEQAALESIEDFNRQCHTPSAFSSRPEMSTIMISTSSIKQYLTSLLTRRQRLR